MKELKRWVIIDASETILGRLSVLVATLLRGKHRPDYSPHSDRGDNVVVINASQVLLTGSKLEKKNFYWHTGWIGGIKKRTAGQILRGSNPENLIRRSIRRMIPRTILGRKQMRNLKIYPGGEHHHTAQKPEILPRKEYVYGKSRDKI